MPPHIGGQAVIRRLRRGRTQMGNDRAVAVDPARPVQARQPGTAALTLALIGLAGASIEW